MGGLKKVILRNNIVAKTAIPIVYTKVYTKALKLAPWLRVAPLRLPMLICHVFVKYDIEDQRNRSKHTNDSFTSTPRM